MIRKVVKLDTQTFKIFLGKKVCQEAGIDSEVQVTVQENCIAMFPMHVKLCIRCGWPTGSEDKEVCDSCLEDLNSMESETEAGSEDSS